MFICVQPTSTSGNFCPTASEKQTQTLNVPKPTFTVYLHNILLFNFYYGFMFNCFTFFFCLCFFVTFAKFKRIQINLLQNFNLIIYGFFNRTAGGQVLFFNFFFFFFIEGIRQKFNNKLTNFCCSCRLAVKGNLFISILFSFLFSLLFVANLE